MVFEVQSLKNDDICLSFSGWLQKLDFCLIIMYNVYISRLDLDHKYGISTLLIDLSIDGCEVECHLQLCILYYTAVHYKFVANVVPVHVFSVEEYFLSCCPVMSCCPECAMNKLMDMTSLKWSCIVSDFTFEESAELSVSDNSALHRIPGPSNALLGQFIHPQNMVGTQVL